MRQPSPIFRGFTLVELLVVIGIISMLTAILLPALASARRTAMELRSQSGLRQMMLGYTTYCNEYNGAVLFGYTPSTVNGIPVTVQDPVSQQVFGSPVSTRYPWRLLPYVSNIWQIIHSHEQLPPMPYAGQSASDAFLTAYTLSLNPTYGINAVFVGGQNGSLYEGFVGPRQDNPNVGHHVVFKANEVRDPTRLIVFADCHTYNQASLAGTGLHYLTPPRTQGQNWNVVNGVITPLNNDAIMGIPQGWYSRRIMVAFFDSHVEAMMPEQMDDMRLWANNAQNADYDYGP